MFAADQTFTNPFPTISESTIGSTLSSGVPTSAEPEADPHVLCRLTIYDFEEEAILDRIARLRERVNCKIVSQEIIECPFPSYAEHYKASFTVDLTNSDQTTLQQWFDSYSQIVDADLDPVPAA
jgi:hypothetical protein